jgi:S1-C subfamily serine protease
MAQDCVGRVLPTIEYRAKHYVSRQATFLLRVVYKDLPDARGQATVSAGSAFVVDRDRGYFLTAKHVLLGNKVWSTHFPNHIFADLEAAIEDYLNSEKVELRLQTDEDASPTSARLIALDRDSDLALLVVSNPNNITLSQFPALFRNVLIPPDGECSGSFKVAAIGFTNSADPKKLERQGTQFDDATCDFFPKTYLIGGQKYRVALFRTKTAFYPGFSGGPVLDSQMRLAGVVSGAALGESKNSFFVPVSAIRSFLARFR